MYNDVVQLIDCISNKELNKLQKLFKDVPYIMQKMTQETFA